MPPIALIFGWVLVAAGTAATGGDNEKASAAEKVLTAKGLTRDDRKFLLDEAAAVEKFEKAKATLLRLPEGAEPLCGDRPVRRGRP